MDTPVSLTVNAEDALHPVSDMLFGIFLEDINFACDGGLNANMVNNASFDGVYLSRKGYGFWRSILFKVTPHEVIDRLRFWSIAGGTLGSRHDEPAAPNSWYARVRPAGAGPCRLENLGYNGGTRHAAAYAMAIRAGQTYRFSCWARSQSYQGSITVRVEDERGAALTETATLAPSGGWSELTHDLPGVADGYGKLVIELDGRGAVDLDAVSLMSTDTWGRGDPRWSQGKLRRDLVEALRDLKPRFMRFPGGCIVEGAGPGNEYNWKDTVGPVINRTGTYNLWGARVKDGGYFQSYEIGFYEYFLLCEDLGMQPLPTLFAGLNCQARSTQCVATDSPAFQQEVVQSYVDLIDYANGDPATSPWAALRAAAGHPEPFGLRFIGVGNENYGADYQAKFALIKQAIDAHAPGITCVMSAWALPQGKAFDETWEIARARYSDIRVDEHCYDGPEWYLKNHRRYDSYPRGGPTAYLGEYAANRPVLGLKPNSYRTALAEAAFLTGLERNSDAVVMSSYAPLFSLSGSQQWAHNLIIFNPAHVLLTANYFVQKLYSTTVGDTVVAMRGELPAGVYASATATPEQLIIKLVNTNAQALPVQLQLDGIPDGPAEVESLHADDLSGANALSFGGKPDYQIAPTSTSLAVQRGRALLALRPYEFAVLVARRA